MTSAIIVAAGKGTRMGPNVDKLFLLLAGKPIVAHTWRVFDQASCIDEIILVVREGMQEAFLELAATYKFTKSFRVAPGGAERQDSVWNGLEAVVPDCDIVAIQDGARPCTTKELIELTILAARETGAAVAAQKITDTIKESDGANFIERNVDRTRLWAVQTPQTFRLEVIRNALREVRARGLAITDDTAACEFIGQKVQLVESPGPNPKATSPADLEYLEMLVSKREEASALTRT